MCHFGSSPKGLRRRGSAPSTLSQGLAPKTLNLEGAQHSALPIMWVQQMPVLLTTDLVLLVLIHTLASHLGFTFHCWHSLQQNLTHLGPRVERQCFPVTLAAASHLALRAPLFGRWAWAERTPCAPPSLHLQCEITLELSSSRGKKNIPGKAFSFYLKIIYNLLSFINALF